MSQSQNTKIKMHLIFRGSITPIEAYNMYGCLRLAARISDLKADGFPVVARLVNDKASGKRYAEYSIASRQQA